MRGFIEFFPDDFIEKTSSSSARRGVRVLGDNLEDSSRGFRITPPL
jgi:hypothetical protein